VSTFCVTKTQYAQKKDFSKGATVDIGGKIFEEIKLKN